MKPDFTKLHPLLRITLILLLIILSVIILYYGRILLLPLSIAAILAMMLNPLMDRMIRHGVPKWLTIVILSLSLVILAGGFFFLLGKQIGVLAQDWDHIHHKLSSLFRHLEHNIQQSLDIPPSDQLSGVRKALPIGDFFMAFIGSLGRVVMDAFLVLIYLILMLAERQYFKQFILNLSAKEKKESAALAVDECVNIASKFLFSRLIIVVILVGIYWLGFWLGGVPYAFFLALLAGVLSIIPVFGNIIGGGLASLLAFVTGGWISVAVVIGVIVVGQLLGDYVLTPWMIGKAVRLNPFVTIFSVIAFTLLWGPVGAIFALPIVAILRILLQSMESTKPYASFLAGGK